MDLFEEVIKLRREGKRGALATIVPADKKIVHGMRDAIMVPTAVDLRR